MKRGLIIVILAAVFLTACGTAKRQAETFDYEADSTESVERIVEKSAVVMDTTMTVQGTVTVTEVEFFPPNAGDSLKNDGECGVDICADAAVVKSPGQGVKRIRQTVISNTYEKKGMTECGDSSETVKAENSVSVSSEAAKEEETPVPASNSWRRVCLIGFAAVAVVALLYLKRVPVLGWIRKILSGLGRF